MVGAVPGAWNTVGGEEHKINKKISTQILIISYPLGIEVPLSHIREPQTKNGTGVSLESSSLFREDEILKSNQSYKSSIYYFLMW